MSTFSDNNCTSNFNPTSYCSGQGFPYNPFSNNDTCYSLFHPPSPLVMSFEEEILLFPYLQNLETQSQSLTTEYNKVPLAAEENVDDSKRNKRRKLPLKTSSKKDRHSKIVTSRGPRDRRMRLSREVAPKFFGLQEMLGFNKASKTLEWLLDKSESAIMEISKAKCGGRGGDGVVGAIRTSSTPSKCEGGVGILGRKNGSNSLSRPKEKNKKTKVARGYSPFTKISRDRARERARERTAAKNKLRIDESRST